MCGDVVMVSEMVVCGDVMVIEMVVCGDGE